MDFNTEDILKVYWLDTVITAGWESIEKAKVRPESAKCISVGWYLYSDDDFLWLAHSRSEAEDGELVVTVIPRGCIKSIQRLND